MNTLDDLSKVVCNRLSITETNQVRCVTNILGDTIAFSDYRKNGLDETRLEQLIKVVGGFVSEIKEVTDSPEYYDQKMKKIKASIVRRERELN